MVFSMVYLSIYLYVYLVSVLVSNIFFFTKKSRILSTFAKKKFCRKFLKFPKLRWKFASRPAAEADCCMEGRIEAETTPPTNHWTPAQSSAPGWGLWSIFEARLKYSTAVTPPSLNLSSAAVGFAVSAEGIFSSLVLQGRRPRWIFSPSISYQGFAHTRAGFLKSQKLYFFDFLFSFISDKGKMGGTVTKSGVAVEGKAATEPANGKANGQVSASIQTREEWTDCHMAPNAPW